jgi:hypothetical protein
MQIQNIIFMLLLFLPQQSNVRREYTPAENIIERNFHNFYDYTLRWGNKQFMRSLPDTFTVNGLNNPYFWFENYQRILLKVNCKQGRSLLRVLPLNDTSQVGYFNDPIVFNQRSNLLVCAQGPHTIKFIDLGNGKTSSLNIRLPKGSKELVLSIKSVTLNNTELRINWVRTPESAIKVYRIPVLK